MQEKGVVEILKMCHTGDKTELKVSAPHPCLALCWLTRCGQFTRICRIPGGAATCVGGRPDYLRAKAFCTFPPRRVDVTPACEECPRVHGRTLWPCC